MEAKRTRKKGKRPLDEAQKRDSIVWVRLNQEELQKLDRLRAIGKKTRSDYLRSVSLSKIPKSIPEINTIAWASLARLLANLNQYQHAVNLGNAKEYPDNILHDLKNSINNLRKELIGASTNES